MNKVKQIIEDEFDGRLGLMVIAYLLDQIGMTRAATITEEDIAAVKGNDFVSDEFMQGIVKAARRIAKECNFTHDVIPYIVTELAYLAKEEN